MRLATFSNAACERRAGTTGSRLALAACGFNQRPDARFDGGVGGEQVGKAFARVVDARHFRSSARFRLK